ncbi:hypothetical protein ACPXCX_48355, partial [Streptomyces sp. DT225]
GVGTGDGAVVRDDLDALLVGAGDPRGGLLGVDRGDRDDLDAVGDLLLELLLLLADVTARVVVDDLAVGAVLLDRVDEQRLVQRLVAGGLVLPDEAATSRPRWLEVNSAARAASRSKSLTR